MSDFEQYASKYKSIRMERRDGILLMTLHTDGGELQWGGVPHGELPRAFHDVGADRENKVIILAGTGEYFSGPRPAGGGPKYKRPTLEWDRVFWEARHLLMNMLDIDVPMIAAVNGPAMRHSELPLMCDIVLASDTATFEDAGHFENGLVPGDGVNIIYPLLLGLNRARYFLLTGQSLGAQEAKELGLVNEVLPKDKLMARAWEHAERLAGFPLLHLKYTRMILVEELKRTMQSHLGYSFLLEGMANQVKPDAPKAA
ncbi:MAG: enoyl-CoA hydratase/isomerase family protein [Burkholderiaceae bacterium]